MNKRFQIKMYFLMKPQEMSLIDQLFSNVKLLIQNEVSPENILLYVQFKTNSYFGRCFTKTDSPIDSKEFIELMTHLDEELLKLGDVWRESYGNTDEIHKLAASFKKWNELVAVNLAIICGLMLDPDAYVAYALNHMSIVHETESERILSIETKQPKIHDEAKMTLRKKCLPMVIVYPCLKTQDKTKYPERLEVLKCLNEDLKIALDQAEGSIDPNTVHQFIKVTVGMNDSSSDESSEEISSEEIEEFVKCIADMGTKGDKPKALSSTISENENSAKPCLGNITVEELESLRKRTEEKFDEDARLLEQLNSKKKYYGVRDEKTTDSVKDLLPLIAMMGHMINLEKSNAKYKEPTVSSNSEKDTSSVLNAEKPNVTPEVKNAHQIMRDLFGAYKIMRDWVLPNDED